MAPAPPLIPLACYLAGFENLSKFFILFSEKGAKKAKQAALRACPASLKRKSFDGPSEQRPRRGFTRYCAAADADQYMSS
jgi:hypothetical protein